MDNNFSSVFERLGLSEEFFVQRGLPRYEDASDLVVVQTDTDGREHKLVPEACQAWKMMQDAALLDGCQLVLVSAFRSKSRQAEIVLRKHLSGISNDEIFAVSAPPGFSEHHTGRAIDLTTPCYAPLEDEFEQSDAFAWLRDHAQDFGFLMTYPRGNEFGFLYEPWHWCYQGAKNQLAGTV